jgi:hypothetical protein
MELCPLASFGVSGIDPSSLTIIEFVSPAVSVMRGN